MADKRAIKPLSKAYRFRYSYERVAGTQHLWRLMELRHTKRGIRYVCIAIGNVAIKDVVHRLDKR